MVVTVTANDFPPPLRDHCSLFGREFIAVCFVVRMLGEVPPHKRPVFFETSKSKMLVQATQLLLGVADQILIAELVEARRIHELAALFQFPVKTAEHSQYMFFQSGKINSLKAVQLGHGFPEVHGRWKNHIWVSHDVNKFRLRKQLQKHLDPAAIQRTLENQTFGTTVVDLLKKAE